MHTKSSGLVYACEVNFYKQVVEDNLCSWTQNEKNTLFQYLWGLKRITQFGEFFPDKRNRKFSHFIYVDIISIIIEFLSGKEFLEEYS
ncbi:12390_t:CDS:2 [Racocetra persica]|uniref:12390_t:CDS:1 n=1 Tax=Racocetra persica TaxID=160502 RepID=A0ACA9M4F4_9GLOM|nr:12390_t:CDS:2 [Racocetra persica]